MSVADFNRSIPEVLADAMNQFTTLVRKETLLARAAMAEKLGDLALGIGLSIGGAVLLIPALVILLQAAVSALIDAGLGATWATLLVGVAGLAVGGVLLSFGIARLRAGRPVPSRTIEQLERDVEVAKQQIKQQVRNDDDPTLRAA